MPKKSRPPAPVRPPLAGAGPDAPVSPDDARARILAAALEEFSAIGYAGARVDAIAGRAGVNKAMLYYHVGGKRELYTVVLTETLERVLAALHAAADSCAGAPEKLKSVVATLARLGVEHPAFVPMVMREIASGGENLPDETVVRMSMVFRFVSSILAEGVRSGDFRAVDPLRTHVTLVGSTMFCVASQRLQERVARIADLPARRFDEGELAAHVSSLILDGIRSGTPPKRSPRRRP